VDFNDRSSTCLQQRAGFVDQAQDRGIEAVRPGAGRDDHDQHERIQRLGQIEPIVDPVRFIDRLVSFESLSSRRGAGDQYDHKQARRGERRKEPDEEQRRWRRTRPMAPTIG